MQRIGPRRQFAIVAAVCCMPFLSPAYAQTVDTGIVQGRVYCSDTQRPARFVHLRLQPIGGIGDRGARGGFANTGADGSFRIANVAPGEYYVEVTMPGYLDPLRGLRDSPELSTSAREQLNGLVTRVSVTAGQSATATVTIYRGGSIDGHVSYDDGGPAAGVSVQAFDASTTPSTGASGSSGYATSDDRGEFRITGLADGTYLVYAAPRSVFPVYFGNTIDRSHARTLEIRAGAEVSGADIEIPAIAMHRVGGVLLGDDGHALAHTPLQMRLSSGGTTSITAISATDGTFVFPAVPDGSFVLQTPGGQQALTISGSDLSDLVIRPSARD